MFLFVSCSTVEVDESVLYNYVENEDSHSNHPVYELLHSAFCSHTNQPNDYHNQTHNNKTEYWRTSSAKAVLHTSSNQHDDIEVDRDKYSDSDDKCDEAFDLNHRNDSQVAATNLDEETAYKECLRPNDTWLQNMEVSKPILVVLAI